MVSHWVYKEKRNGTPGSVVDGLRNVYLKVFLKMLSQCTVLEIFNLVFCLSTMVSDFAFLWILLVCRFGVSLFCMCFSVSPSPVHLFFIFVLVGSLFYWPVCFLRSERKKAWTWICGEVGKI